MIEHIIVYTCDQCKNTTEERCKCFIDEVSHSSLKYPCPPLGWRVVGSNLFCGRHEVTVTITDKPLAVVGVEETL